MKFTWDTEVEQIDLTASQIITRRWLDVQEADRQNDYQTAEAGKRTIKRYLDNTAEAHSASGGYRVIWGRQQVIVLLPVAK